MKPTPFFMEQCRCTHPSYSRYGHICMCGNVQQHKGIFPWLCMYIRAFSLGCLGIYPWVLVQCVCEYMRVYGVLANFQPTSKSVQSPTYGRGMPYMTPQCDLRGFLSWTIKYMSKVRLVA